MSERKMNKCGNSLTGTTQNVTDITAHRGAVAYFTAAR